MKDRFENFTITKEEKVIDALKKIDANRQGFVIVVDEQAVVLGVINDGDIR